VQVLALGTKSALPETVTLTGPLVAVPVLVTVKVSSALEAPSATEPNAWVFGEMVRDAAPDEEPDDEEPEELLPLLELPLEELLLDELVVPVPPSVVGGEFEQPVAKARASEARTAVFRKRFELKREDVVVIVFFSTGFSPLKQLFKQLFSSTGFPPSKANSRARA
jgi:hypothetical protein